MLPASNTLAGVRVLDLSALGPGPFASMLLDAHGAEVIHVVRPGVVEHDTSYFDGTKTSIAVDLKSTEGRDIVRRLAMTADVFLESYRPGAMERLGLGPDELREVNDRLIYVRLTGWGQHGPYAARAGHDINYISIAGVLSAVGGPTVSPPLALLGDFASGGLFAVIGTLLALHERTTTGKGKVVDAAIVDGAAVLLWSTIARSLRGDHGPRGTNLTDGGRPYYRAYRCADGRYFSLGAIEPKFYADCIRVLELDDIASTDQNDPASWPIIEGRIAAAFEKRTRDEWTEVFSAADACGTPVLDATEMLDDQHLRARATIVHDRVGDVAVRAAPRFSDGVIPAEQAERVPRDPRRVLIDAGISAESIDALVEAGWLTL